MSDYANASFEAPLARGGVLTQTWALLIDAYRELNAKKLFWITLILSVLVAGAFFLVGIDATGIRIAGYSLPGGFNTTLIARDQFFKLLFASFAVPWWLGFFASILALISVGSIFPDLLSGGAIDLYVSKPISRLRLFLTKYVFGLAFAATQVAVFTFVSFLVIGIRGGSWDPKVFIAVPIVTLYFSYLYCVCTFVGVLTRSTLAAILVTVLLWGVLFLVNVTDAVLVGFKQTEVVQLETQDRLIAFNRGIVDRNAALPPERRANLSKTYDFFLAKSVEARPAIEARLHTLALWHRGVFIVKSFLPKTGETVDLLSRSVIDAETTRTLSNRRRNRGEQLVTNPKTGEAEDENEDEFRGNPEVARRTQAEIRGRSVWWVTGTSVAFEFVVLSLAAWVFCRRDY